LPLILLAGLSTTIRSREREEGDLPHFLRPVEGLA